MHGRTHCALGAAAFLVVTGCVAASPEGEGAGPSEEDKSFGSIHFPDDSCSPEEQRLIVGAFADGKWAAAQPAFEEAVLGSEYWPCRYDPDTRTSRTDPHARVDRDALDLEALSAQAVELARHPSDLWVTCFDDASSLGQAMYGSPDLGGPEQVEITHQLLDLALHDAACTTQDECLSSQDCVDGRCREASPGWVHRQVAATLWHEVMHQRGYLHVQERLLSVQGCGYDPGDGYDAAFSMPEIVERAILQILANQCDTADPCAHGYRSEECGRPFGQPEEEGGQPLAVCREESRNGDSEVQEHLHLTLDPTGSRVVGAFQRVRTDYLPGSDEVSTYWETAEATLGLTVFAEEERAQRFVGSGYWHGRGEGVRHRAHRPVCRRWGSAVDLREIRFRPIPGCEGADAGCYRVCLSDEADGCEHVCYGDGCDARGDRPAFLRDMRCIVDPGVLDRLTPRGG